MSRIRGIHPDLFRDEKFVSVSVTARFVWIGLLTMCDPEGHFPLSHQAVKLRTMPADCVDVEPIISELIGAGLIEKLADGKTGRIIRPAFSVGGRPFDITAKQWSQLRKRVFERDNWACRYCGCVNVDLECDHVEPVSSGGQTVFENLAAACRPCNSSKGRKSLASWRGVP